MTFQKKAGLAMAMAAIFTVGGSGFALAADNISITDGDNIAVGAKTGDYFKIGDTDVVLTDTEASVGLANGTTLNVTKGQILVLGQTAADDYATEITITGADEAGSVINLNGGSGGNLAQNGAGKAIDVIVATATLNLNGSGTLADGDNDAATNAVLKLSNANVTVNVRGDYSIDSVVIGNARAALNVAGAKAGESGHLNVAFLDSSSNASTIRVGTAAAGAGVLTAARAELDGATIFADPAFGKTYGDNTSYVNLDGWGTDPADPSNNIDGKLVAGRNSVITVGGTTNTWMNGIISNLQQSTKLSWGKEITAAFGFASAHDLDAKGNIVVDGAITSDPATNTDANTIFIANNSLTVFDLTGLEGGVLVKGVADGTETATDITSVYLGGFTNDTAPTGTEVTGNAYVYFDNARNGGEYVVFERMADFNVGDDDAISMGAAGELTLENAILTKSTDASTGKYWTGENLIMSSELLGGQLYLRYNTTNTNNDLVLKVGFKDNVDEIYPLLSSSMTRMVSEVYKDAENDTFFNRADKTNTFEAGEAGIAFISRLTDNSFMPDHALAAAVLEGAAQISVAAGVPAVTNNVITKVSSMIVDHANMLASTQPAYGNEPGAFGLWASPFYGMSDVDGIKPGAFEAGYEMNYGGAAFGFDYNVNEAFRLGLALNVGGGDTESKGDFVNTENDFDFFGVGLYGSYSNGAFGLTGDVGYTGVDSDITQDLPAGLRMGGIKSAVDSDALTLGLTGQYRFTTSSNFNITPHAGIRFTQISTDEARVEAGGSRILDVETDDQNLFQTPI